MREGFNPQRALHEPTGSGLSREEAKARIAKHREKIKQRDDKEKERLDAIAFEDSNLNKPRRRPSSEVRPSSTFKEDKTVEIPLESKYKNPKVDDLIIDVTSGETDDKASSRFRSERADLASERRSAEIAQRKRAEELSKAIREGFGM